MKGREGEDEEKEKEKKKMKEEKSGGGVRFTTTCPKVPSVAHWSH
jgi:hypothetical protein